MGVGGRGSRRVGIASTRDHARPPGPIHVAAERKEGPIGGLTGEQLLTVADVASRVGAHEATIRGWIKAGQLPAIQFDGRVGYRIRASELEAFLRRRTLTGEIARRLLGNDPGPG